MTSGWNSGSDELESDEITSGGSDEVASSFWTCDVGRKDDQTMVKTEYAYEWELWVEYQLTNVIELVIRIDHDEKNQWSEREISRI